MSDVECDWTVKEIQKQIGPEWKFANGALKSPRALMVSDDFGVKAVVIIFLKTVFMPTIMTRLLKWIKNDPSMNKYLHAQLNEGGWNNQFT